MVQVCDASDYFGKADTWNVNHCSGCQDRKEVATTTFKTSLSPSK